MKQPSLVIPSHIDMPMAHRHTLTNGTSLYVLPTPEFEVLRFTFVFHAGSSLQSVPFCASATANLLSEGTRNFTAEQIATELDFYGSHFEVNVDRDCVYVTFNCLSKFFEQTLAVAREILLYPTFPEEEVSVYREKRKASLAIERRKVETAARELFGRLLFGGTHPYGVTYPESAYDDLTRDDLSAFYRDFYSNALVICSGGIGDNELRSLQQLACELPATGMPVAAAPPPAKSTGYGFTERPDAVQSSIRVGRLLFTRTHPDFVPMQVLTTALGGYFGSRLMQNLREKRGYTYGVHASMINFQHAGYLGIATQVGTEVTDDALNQIYAEIERLRMERMPEEELSLVKNIMVGEVLRILDGPFGIADVTIENLLCGLDNSYVSRSVEMIRDTTPDDIQHLAQQYLRREDLVTAVAGAHI